VSGEQKLQILDKEWLWKLRTLNRAGAVESV